MAEKYILNQKMKRISYAYKCQDMSSWFPWKRQRAHHGLKQLKGTLTVAGEKQL